MLLTGGVGPLKIPGRETGKTGAEGLLVGSPGFKPVVPAKSRQVGSIPMRSRQFS